MAGALSKPIYTLLDRTGSVILSGVSIHQILCKVAVELMAMDELGIEMVPKVRRNQTVTRNLKHEE